MPSLDHIEEVKIVAPTLSNREHLYNVAKAHIGVDLTPKDEVPDSVACVAQLQEVFRQAFGRHIGTGAALYSTKALKEASLVDVTLEHIEPGQEMFGDICVFATGENTHQTAPGTRGHVFIVGKHDWMSNDSDTGLWKAHWSKDAVYRYFVRANGFPQYVFRVKGDKV